MNTYMQEDVEKYLVAMVYLTAVLDCAADECSPAFFLLNRFFSNYFKINLLASHICHFLLLSFLITRRLLWI